MKKTLESGLLLTTNELKTGSDYGNIPHADQISQKGCFLHAQTNALPDVCGIDNSLDYTRLFGVFRGMLQL